MGMSLSVYVFWGVKFPDGEDYTAPKPRLREGVLPGVYDHGDLYYLTNVHKEIDTVRSGVCDYTTAHLAVKSSIVRGEYEPIPLIVGAVVPLEWRTQLASALADLEWTKKDDEGETVVVPAPDLTPGWYVCACYW